MISCQSINADFQLKIYENKHIGLYPCVLKGALDRPPLPNTTMFDGHINLPNKHIYYFHKRKNVLIIDNHNINYHYQ